MNSIFKSFVKYVSLNILGMMSIAICIFIDTFFISKAMGADGLTALNFAIPIYSTISGLGLMLGIGGGARYASLKVQNRNEEANKIFTTALKLGLAVAACCMIIGAFFATQISLFLGAEGHILPMTSAYLRTILLLSPGLILLNIFSSFVRNDGNPKSAMIATVIFSVMNIGLDYLFIIVFGWGMYGAAFATKLASFCGFFFLLSKWLRKETNFYFVKEKLHMHRIKEICSTGLPTLIGELSNAVVLIVFNLIIVYLKGNVGVAAFGIISNLAFVTIAIFMGVGQGVQPLVSTYYGKGDQRGLDTVLKYAALTVVGLALSIYGISYFFTDALTGIFNHEQDVFLASLANEGVRIYFIGFIFVGLNIVIITYLSVTSAPRAAFILSLLRGGVLIIPLVLLLAQQFGIVGVWLSYPVAELLTTMIATYCLLRVTRKKTLQERLVG